LRLGALRATLLFAISLRLHHHFQFHGPPFDYGALALAAAASWIGVPGPGEPVLIAAGVFAAQHRLDITEVLLVAWLAAMLGGVGGWVVGRIAGRTVLTAPGPLRPTRLKAVDRGDQVFKRVPVIAIVLAPTWVAGIHRVRASLYLPVNAISSFVWAVGIGLGAYFVGPAVVDFVNDLGWVLGSALLVLVVGSVAAGVLRRRRRGQAREPAAAGEEEAPPEGRATSP
jgi:membrane protein DedA with SNARE-associated domain